MNKLENQNWWREIKFNYLIYIFFYLNLLVIIKFMDLF